MMPAGLAISTTCNQLHVSFGGCSHYAYYPEELKTGFYWAGIWGDPPWFLVQEKQRSNQRIMNWPASNHRGEGDTLGAQEALSGQIRSFIQQNTLLMSYSPFSPL